MSQNSHRPDLDRFDFDLPDCLIARHPVEVRDHARLLDVLGDPPADRAVRDLPDLLRPGDLLVFNDTRVQQARVQATRHTGGKVEVFFLPGGRHAMLRPARRIKMGELLKVGDHHIKVGDRQPDGTFEVEAQAEVIMAQHGEVPLPPYLKRQPVASDSERYQTVFAQELGAVAAPTAGLHFTPMLLDTLRARGVNTGFLTLHVGAGTFRPLRTQDIERRALHAESFEISPGLAQAVHQTRQSGGRVVACGTTVTRALESAWDGHELVPGPATTTLFVQERDQLRVVDLLFTNFHLPRSSLLMLVCAFGGHERVLSAYRHAIRQDYRFYSYGDAMLLGPS